MQPCITRGCMQPLLADAASFASFQEKSQSAHKSRCTTIGSISRLRTKSKAFMTTSDPSSYLPEVIERSSVFRTIGVLFRRLEVVCHGARATLTMRADLIGATTRKTRANLPAKDFAYVTRKCGRKERSVRAARNSPAKSSRIREWGIGLRGLPSRSIADANFTRRGATLPH